MFPPWASMAHLIHVRTTVAPMLAAPSMAFPSKASLGLALAPLLVCSLRRARSRLAWVMTLAATPSAKSAMLIELASSLTCPLRRFSL